MSDHIAAASADDTLAVADALYRFGAALDREDFERIDSVFDEDAVIDFGPCGRKLGLDYASVVGRPEIIGFLRRQHEAQRTTHVVTNARVRLEASGATLQALVDATHIARADSSRRFRMMNWYDAELVCDERLWRVRRLVIDNAWFEGDPNVLSVEAVRS